MLKSKKKQTQKKKQPNNILHLSQTTNEIENVAGDFLPFFVFCVLFLLLHLRNLSRVAQRQKF